VLKKGQFKNAVKMNNIEKYFGHIAALKGVNFEQALNLRFFLQIKYE